LRGLDTNVLLRYLTYDDPVQSPAAARLFEQAEAAGERFHVTTTVLCELIWTLRGRLYRQTRADAADLVDALLETALFEVQERDLVRRALADFRTGSGDFADYLIGWQNQAAGCRSTVTFDRDLADCGRFEELVTKRGR
jgi:predicted nucleic-acid-binding protein